MELINTKERILLAEKGHELLKQKRDVLVLEFMDILHNSRLLRGKLNESMKAAYKALATAESYHSIFELENIALSVRETQRLKTSVRNTMGVKLPRIQRKPAKRRMSERGYSIIASSAKVDQTAENFEGVLDITLELAEKEVSMKKLLIEIEKNKRRVNALEYVMIPGLQATQRNITLKLDEMEREGFSTLKTIKTQMEKKAAAD